MKPKIKEVDNVIVVNVEDKEIKKYGKVMVNVEDKTLFGGEAIIKVEDKE